MSDARNHQSMNRPNIPHERELIVVVNRQAGFRATRQGGTSIAGQDVSPLSDLLTAEDASLEPLFGEEERLQQRGASFATPEEMPDLSVYYRVRAADEKLDELASRLLEQDEVEAAYVKPAAELAVILEQPRQQTQEYASDAINSMVPLADRAPAVTPDFTSRQGYLNPAPEGIDARYAWTVEGGRGRGINIIDLEWGWNFSHEDLRQEQGGVVGGTNSSDDDHGTAVIGELGGDRNGFGVTGICSEARVSAVAFSMPTATAIRLAADRLRAGDIMLLEIHRPGPRFNFERRSDQRGYIAVEWWPDDYAAIAYAVAKGIVVVEAAGNGAENLDDALYNQRPSGFPQSWRNPFNIDNPSSGAVLVGAGAPPPGTHGRDHGPNCSRLGFSNFGARVDAQGWGREVTTTGYGDLQGGNDKNLWYADRFSGTSSASPIVTGALACVQGVLRSRSLPPLNSEQARRLLRSTGSPQQDAPDRPRTQRIGHRPDLRQLIPHALFSTPGDFCGVWRAGSGAHYLWANVEWDSFRAKWQELSQAGLRLVDFYERPVGNTVRYSGVWRAGTDAHYLWVNTDWDDFKAKWQELSQNGLRLTRISVRSVGNSLRYSGVWRAGTDAHYLWVNANWDSFRAKWQELSQQGLRLVDFHQHSVGGEARYSGVWRAGTDAHYLWVNADWLSFWAKWQELSEAGLRLQALSINRVGQANRYSGVWRAGTDAHYLWLSTTWSGFESKWQDLSQQGLRLTNFVHVADSSSSSVALTSDMGGLAERSPIHRDSNSNSCSSGDGGGELSSTISVAAIGNGGGLLHSTPDLAIGDGGGTLFN